MPSGLLNDIVIYLGHGGPENAAVTNLVSEAKRNYVRTKHTQAISQMHTTNRYKDGRWRTMVYEDGKRREVLRKTEKEIYDWLYDFYKKQEDAGKTLEDVFFMLQEKKRLESRTDATLYEDRRHFSKLDSTIRSRKITDITDEDLRRWLVTSYLPTKPKPEGCKKVLQIIKATFSFGQERKICFDNPMQFIRYADYANMCDLNTKPNEEKFFSEEETAILREYALKHQKNPQAVGILLSIETGMRSGELAFIKKYDIENGFLHIHGQQVRRKRDGHQVFVDVEYTKNERMHPQNGRYLPITPGIEEVLRIAAKLPGESEYILHTEEGRAVNKDYYMEYLRRVCGEFRIKVTRNHGFRIAFNIKLINEGLDSHERCLILGHNMQTNERYYSYSDKRRLDDIRKKMISGS